jgi:hypothetical protein
MMSDFGRYSVLYLSNYYHWARGLVKGLLLFPSTPKRQWLAWLAMWCTTNLLSMLTGGDPYETVSSSWHKDRESSWIAKYGAAVLDKIDPNHTEKAYNPNHGEGSPNNREIPGPWRLMTAGWWLIAFAGVTWMILQ